MDKQAKPLLVDHAHKLMERTPNHEVDNLDLILRIQNKDAAAFEQLYERYSGALLRIILGMVPARETAEEILQDAFLKIWNHAGQYDAGRGRLFTWMVQIAKNSARDRTKTRRFQQHSEQESLEVHVNNEQWADAGLPPDDVGLRRVVSQLKERHRQIVEYLYFRDFTQRETSEALGIPLGTIKTEVRKAILELRTILGSEKT